VPARAESFVVRSGTPNAGWWPIAVTADDVTADISASNVNDPVPRLLAWLEQIVKGRAARVLIDEEGEQTEIMAYPKDEGLVRLIVFRYDEIDDEKRIDVLLRLRDVVVQFYAAVQDLAKDEALFKKEWVFHLDPGSVAQPPLSSETVEAFLADTDIG
jgi:hypothetical protein